MQWLRRARAPVRTNGTSLKSIPGETTAKVFGWRRSCGSRRSSAAELEEDFDPQEPVDRVDVRSVSASPTVDLVPTSVPRVENVAAALASQTIPTGASPGW